MDPLVRRRRVLVVEDDLLTLESMAELVESEGYEPITARTGAEALAFVRETTPDVIITDIDLPGGSGLSLVRAVRTLARSTPVAVFVASGRAAAVGREEALAAGADEFFSKPLDFDEVLAHVRRHLEAEVGADADE